VDGAAGEWQDVFSHEEENFATTGREHLQPRGGKFCYYEEEAKLMIFSRFRK